MGKPEENKSAEVQVTRDWTRPQPLNVEGKDPSKAYRWVDKDKIEQRKYEGWNPVDNDKVRYKNPDGEQGTSKTQYRELVLCEMPKEKAESRNQFYRERARRAMDSVQAKYLAEARRLGVRTDI